MNIILSLKAVLLFVLAYSSNGTLLKNNISCLSQSSSYSNLLTSLNKCLKSNLIDIIECTIESGDALSLIVKKPKSCLDSKLINYLESISKTMQKDPLCFSYYSLIKYTEKVRENKKILEKIKKTYKTSILEDFWLMKTHLDIFDNECPYSSYKDSSDLFEISYNLYDLEKHAGPFVILAEFFDAETQKNIENYIEAGKDLLNLLAEKVKVEEKTTIKDFPSDKKNTCDNYDKGENDNNENLVKNITNLYAEINELKIEIKSNKAIIGVLVDEIRGLINEMKIYNEVSQYLIKENTNLKKIAGDKEDELNSCKQKLKENDIERDNNKKILEDCENYNRDYYGDSDDNYDEDSYGNYNEDENDNYNEDENDN
ncbi:hypothetical protein SteCoe_36063 [Stentor coeruleus]|uniref:Uncharacterized protein n=1 Tax=Stentor coeruleus TaxID=5963 RepID=A0A1R2AR91_9CILI|nr:hypothetical protein SteCoe_36063 [Stentor coeruleus]